MSKHSASTWHLIWQRKKNFFSFLSSCYWGEAASSNEKEGMLMWWRRLEALVTWHLCRACGWLGGPSGCAAPASERNDEPCPRIWDTSAPLAGRQNNTELHSFIHLLTVFFFRKAKLKGTRNSDGALFVAYLPGHERCECGPCKGSCFHFYCLRLSGSFQQEDKGFHRNPSCLGDGLGNCLIVLDCRGGREDAAIHLRLPRSPLSLLSCHLHLPIQSNCLLIPHFTFL